VNILFNRVFTNKNATSFLRKSSSLFFLQELRPLTPLKATDRFTSLTVIGMMKIMCNTNCEAIWLRKLLTGLFDLEMEATMILCDNQRCIKMTKNLVFHDKSKHIEVQYHYIRDMVQRGAIQLQYVRTDE
jgi:hypothetical protein